MCRRWPMLICAPNASAAVRPARAPHAEQSRFHSRQRLRRSRQQSGGERHPQLDAHADHSHARQSRRRRSIGFELGTDIRFTNRITLAGGYQFKTTVASYPGNTGAGRQSDSAGTAEISLPFREPGLLHSDLRFPFRAAPRATSSTTIRTCFPWARHLC